MCSEYVIKAVALFQSDLGQVKRCVNNINTFKIMQNANKELDGYKELDLEF